MRSLDDRVVVVTGAASGIGRALARECGRHGARLALSDVDEVGLAETAALLRADGVREVRTDRLDVADRAAFAAYADAVAAHFGRVNVVVNNAGVALLGDLLDVSWDDVDWLLGVDLAGVLHGTKLFLPHLVASGEGHLVTISSLFGLVAAPGHSLYNTAKFGVRGLSEAVRQEMLVAGHPVGVTVVHPGGIRTAIARNARASAHDDRDETARVFDERLARTSPERAAALVVRAVLRDRPRVVVGPDAHVVRTVAALLGARYQDVAARLVRRARPAATRVDPSLPDG